MAISKSTDNVRIKVTRSKRTDDVPDFTTRVVVPDGDETIEDGLAMRAELARYGDKPAADFTELDSFFGSLD